MKPFMLFVVLVLPLLTPAQTTVKPDTWEHFRFFVGTWMGTGKGEPGTSILEREYKLVLNNKFINVTHKSRYEPQTRNPKGETHEDWGYISFDRVRKLHVLRQFHVEGFVTQYYAQTLTPDGKTIVFLSENLENLPAGYKARETWKILNENEFIEVFELAPPGKEFSVYSENHFKRRP
ncbi:MAG TPA: hypothetical protein VJV03_01155 [Pyrinomonadaceae bacterium]|nr:hypothetical protein [Pyrinomonadaceae bacterium]